MDITSLGVATVGVITIICYAIGYSCKQSEKVKDNIIPIIVVCAGAILGAVGKYVIPEFPAQDILTAIAVGIVSGMVSTWTNQVYKQMNK